MFKPQNSQTEIGQIIIDLEHRLKKAEKDNKNFEDKTEILNRALTKNNENIKYQVELLLEHIEYVKKTMKLTVKNMESFVKILKLKGKKRDYEMVKDKVDNWVVPKSISKQDFSKIL